MEHFSRENGSAVLSVSALAEGKTKRLNHDHGKVIKKNTMLELQVSLTRSKKLVGEIDVTRVKVGSC